MSDTIRERTELDEAAVEAAVKAYDIARTTCGRNEGEHLIDLIDRSGCEAMRAAITAYLAALPVDEGAFTAALHDYAERCYINATNNANEAMIGEERDLKQAVLSLYRQKGGA